MGMQSVVRGKAAKFGHKLGMFMREVHPLTDHDCFVACCIHCLGAIVILMPSGKKRYVTTEACLNKPCLGAGK